MPATRRLLLSALPFTATSALAVGLPATGATPLPPPLPQYVIHFSAIGLPATPIGLQFHSISCAIGLATDPIVVTCQETGTIRFTTTGGSGSASVSSALAGINWMFTLTRSNAVTNTYKMVGYGTESVGATPVVRPVKVTGKLTVKPTPDPTISGTEDVHLDHQRDRGRVPEPPPGDLTLRGTTTRVTQK
jgi:hypothetical protein